MSAHDTETLLLETADQLPDSWLHEPAFTHADGAIDAPHADEETGHE